MKCENCFCVYQSKDKCLLDSIELDILGQCTSCIYANIDETVLENAKKSTIRKMESYYD